MGYAAFPQTARGSLAVFGNGEKRHARVEVEVSVHASEQPLLRAAAAAGPEHDEVVAAALELRGDLRSRLTLPLHGVHDELRGHGLLGRGEDAARPGVVLPASS